MPDLVVLALLILLIVSSATYVESTRKEPTLEFELLLLLVPVVDEDCERLGELVKRDMRLVIF